MARKVTWAHLCHGMKDTRDAVMKVGRQREAETTSATERERERSAATVEIAEIEGETTHEGAPRQGGFQDPLHITIVNLRSN